MNDMTSVIAPRSDQLNADSLLAGPITITITKVEIRPGTEQPVSIFHDADASRPYKCCKSMARVLVHCWGPDASKYVGRSLTLYCDPEVKWGGMAVGGIRISHMSDISAQQVMALTVTKGNKKPFTVRPLATRTQDAKPTVTLSDWIATTLPGFIAECATPADLDKLTASRVYVAALGKADDAQKGEMERLIGAARATRVVDGVEGDAAASMPADTPSPATAEAEALIKKLPDLRTNADVVAWRINATVKDAMGKMSGEARALVEAAIEARRGVLNEGRGGLV